MAFGKVFFCISPGSKTFLVLKTVNLERPIDPGSDRWKLCMVQSFADEWCRQMNGFYENSPDPTSERSIRLPDVLPTFM